MMKLLVVIAVLGQAQALRFQKEKKPGTDDAQVNFAKGDSATLLSQAQSSGFFTESNAQWMERQHKHEDQMRFQNELMHGCPADAEMKQCRPGCVEKGEAPLDKRGKPKFCKDSQFWKLHYQPSFNCSSVERIGATENYKVKTAAGMTGDGGKWVCDASKLRQKKECLVYSIGSNGQYDFEKSIHDKLNPNCEIHTMDRNHWRQYNRGAPPKYVNYHIKTIGEAPNTPVDSLITELGHSGREIDIFKIDCEGCEWRTYKSWFGANTNIRQILVEIHGTNEGKAGKEAHEFFHFLRKQGYVAFSREQNFAPVKDPGCQIEYSFVKVSPQFALGGVEIA